MVGAQGTLGLITEVSLKVLPVAPAEATLRFELVQARALEQLHRWGAQPLPLNASCWVHDASDATRPGLDCLFVRLRGALAAVQAAQLSMLSDVPGEVVPQPQACSDWERCRDQQLPFFTSAPGEGFGLWRMSLPQTAPVIDLPWPQLLEWHGGLRWLWAPLSEGETVRSAARVVGGLATLFIAVDAGHVRPGGALDPQTAAARQIAARIKTSFDPHRVFNPGRIDLAV
jgi:glycolate oxidase FAD binding subunit